MSECEGEGECEGDLWCLKDLAVVRLILRGHLAESGDTDLCKRTK